MRGLIRTGFTEDLKIGQDAEGRLAQILLKSGSDIEVKSDKRAHLTGNIYVETTFKGNPSGILTSKAQHWVYEIKERFYIFKREDLLTLVERAYSEGKRRTGGDYGNTEGVLIPVEWLVFKNDSKYK